MMEARFQPSAALARPRSVAGNDTLLWAAMLLALLSALPVLVARYPQMSDYPAHLARYGVMIDGGRTPALARYYSFHWQWTGNVGADLLIRPLAALFGLENGGRVMAGLIPPLTGLGLIAVDYALRRRVTGASLLAMAFIWSPMMLTGLLNFALGQALALLAFALWVVLAGRRWRAALFIPAGLVVWLCHLSAWGMLGVMIFGFEWHALHRSGDWWRAFVRPWPLLAPVTLMLLPGGTQGSFSYGEPLLTYKLAIWFKAMRDTAYPLDFAGLVAVLAVIGIATRYRRIDGRLGWSTAALLVLSLAVPRHISNGDYADYRLVTSGLMLACLAIDCTGAPKWTVALAPALYLVRLAVTTVSWQADSLEMEKMLQALDHLPDGARVANAVLVPGDAWRLNPFEHIGGYAVIRKHALINTNFALAHVHMLSLRQGGPGFIDPSQRIFQLSTQPVELASFVPARQADWLWYVGAKEPASLPPGAQVVWRGEHSLLARLKPVVVKPGLPAPR
ncbi:hypothetical protein [Novosphingobium rosa]|uniref:hypothetical protein n=1 Tax=Novosphingobium rosa TaxID=76978 RepID=UPI000ABE9407|nr:hypothetical protein [Novosphingobium rosa]